MSHHIKGGGRATLNEETEEALTSLLLSLSLHNNKRNSCEASSSLLPAETLSDHERKRQHRRFVKKLETTAHRRTVLNNNTSSSSSRHPQMVKSSEDDCTRASRDDNVTDHTKETNVRSINTTNYGVSGKKKIRVELIEAVYSSGKKNNKDKKDFKEGGKKVVVLPTETSIEDLMKDAKAKLRMKKKPTKCFVMVEKKVRVELQAGDNLQGLKDGEKVYVTSHVEETETKRTKPQSKTGKEDETTDMDEGDEEIVDPLDAVKAAYSQRNRRSTRKGGQPAVPFIPMKEYPRLADYADRLPELSPERASLPAAACRSTILESLEESQVLIVCGSTGCGKSTQIPQFLLEGMTAAGQLQGTNIIVTQPRRVAATTLAQRVSTERNCPGPGKTGSEVGYIVRLDRAVSDTTKIVYCTVGILLRMLVCPRVEGGNREGRGEDLSGVSHVVVDEVHERDVNTDFVLTLIKRLLATNKTIRIILMSATASAQLFVDYFSGVGRSKPNVIDIPGRSYPVDIHWLTDCERFCSSRVNGWLEKLDDSTVKDSFQSSDNGDHRRMAPRATSKIDNEFIRDLIRALVDKQRTDGELKLTKGGENFRKAGAILVMLPGKGEIEALAKVLYQHPLVGNRDICKILKLHSTTPRAEQQAVFNPSGQGTVKVVLATNIAETSITIPDVSHVIDTGRVKESRFNPSTRTKELTTVWTSQASAQQRAGRAGRTSKGTAWRLYSQSFTTNYMPEQTSPEILRTPLDDLVVQLCLLFEHKFDLDKTNGKQCTMGVCPIKFLSNAPEPPEESRLIEACGHLLEVGAVRIVARQPRFLYRLTPLGYHLSRLPMDAKLGKVLLVGCLLGCLDNSLTVAASLSNTKSCFPSRWSSVKETEWSVCLQARDSMVENGFGGRSWSGGTVKGDCIAAIAAYREWAKKRSDKDRHKLCRKCGIDNLAMVELSSLRSQFMDCLQDAGFVDQNIDAYNSANDDALLTSCCLVAGLYPNISTLTRPRKGGPKGGRLLTKDGDSCRPSSSSFQRDRVRNVSETGKDAYAVFHSKHRVVGTGERPGDVFLSELNFVSRFALLLFGGELAVEKTSLIVDGWLKFKVGNKGTAIGVLLIQELRLELDNVMLQHIVCRSDNAQNWKEERGKNVIQMVRRLLEQE